MMESLEQENSSSLKTSVSRRQKAETRFWLQILNVHHLIYNELNARLINKAGLSVAKFDVLAQLHRFPEGISMGALSKKLKVTNGNVSGLVTRLEADGYVKRSVEPNDRRSFRASMTPAGKAVFEMAMAQHQTEISRKLSGIDLDEIEKMTSSLKRITDQIRGPGDENRSE